MDGKLVDDYLKRRGWKWTRHYSLADLGERRQWTARLIVFAREALGLARFRVSELSPDMVYAAFAENKHALAVCLLVERLASRAELQRHLRRHAAARLVAVAQGEKCEKAAESEGARRRRPPMTVAELAGEVLGKWTWWEVLRSTVVAFSLLHFDLVAFYALADCSRPNLALPRDLLLRICSPPNGVIVIVLPATRTCCRPTSTRACRRRRGSSCFAAAKSQQAEVTSRGLSPETVILQNHPSPVCSLFGSAAPTRSPVFCFFWKP